LTWELLQHSLSAPNAPSAHSDRPDSLARFSSPHASAVNSRFRGGVHVERRRYNLMRLLSQVPSQMPVRGIKSARKTTGKACVSFPQHTEKAGFPLVPTTIVKESSDSCQGQPVARTLRLTIRRLFLTWRGLGAFDQDQLAEAACVSA